MKTAILERRAVLAIQGLESTNFLQGILTNDVEKMSIGELKYMLLLTPQGKILYDFFVYKVAEDKFLLDYPKAHAQIINTKLKLYKLRADAEITLLPDYKVLVSQEQVTQDFLPDPRGRSLGYRAFLDNYDWLGQSKEVLKNYEYARIEAKITDAIIDWDQSEFFPMELGMDYAISYTKGCYIGQEVVARTAHRGQVRKGVYHLLQDSSYSDRGAHLFMGDKKVGKLMGTVGNDSLAVLRHEFVEGFSNETLTTASGITAKIKE